MGMVLLIKILLLVCSILTVGYFAGSETALMSITMTTIGRLKEKYPGKASSLLYWERKPNRVLTAMLVGTNLACIAAGVIATSIAFDLSSVHPAYTWLMPVIVTVAILLFGEILPKVYSRYNQEKVSALNIVPLVAITRITLPVSELFIWIAQKIMKKYGKEDPFLNRSELRLLLSVAEQEAATDGKSGPDTITIRQRKMLTNILSFVDRRISHVMRPRSEIFAVDAGRKLEDNVTQILFSEYSRIPVYRRSLDNIIGIIYTKDLTTILQKRKLFLLDDLIRPAYFVPENASVSNLLREFKKGRQHMAVAVDEYGTTAGLVTIEDIVEEIVGEIYDEYDTEEKKIMQLSRDSWMVFGDETLANINEQLGTGLFMQGVVTINGLIAAKLGRIPGAGEEVKLEGLEIKVAESDSRKIKKLEIRKST